MSLAISRPFKHPRTGIYWLRKRVPQDWVALVGRREVTRGLGTRDPSEAKRKLAHALADLEAQWASLRTGKRAITDRKAHALALPFFERWLDDFRDSPSEQLYWHPDLHAAMWTRCPLPETPPAGGEPGSRPVAGHSAKTQSRSKSASQGNILDESPA